MLLSDSSDRHPADHFLPDLLARASHAALQGFAAELRGRGISLPVWRVLAALSARSGETVTGLADTCLLQQPTMTKLLDRMEGDGLVARTPDGRDRRLVRVSLTPDGEAEAAGLVEAARRYEARLLALHPEAAGIKAALVGLASPRGPVEPNGRGGSG